MTPAIDEREERVEHDGGMEEVSEDRAAEREHISFKFTGIVWLIVGIIEALIGLRIVFKLLEANAANAFVDFIYSVSRPLVSPFFGIVAEPSADGSVFEVGSLIAMFVYLLIGWGVAKLLEILLRPTEVRRMRTVHRH